jgi:hypothetical protein
MRVVYSIFRRAVVYVAAAAAAQAAAAAGLAHAAGAVSTPLKTRLITVYTFHVWFTLTCQ